MEKFLELQHRVDILRTSCPVCFFFKKKYLPERFDHGGQKGRRGPQEASLAFNSLWNWGHMSGGDGSSSSSGFSHKPGDTRIMFGHLQVKS